LRHSQRKRGATDRPDLRSMAPVLDPTGLDFETRESSKASANKDYSQKVGQCSPICLRMILG
jgi:hypothetical protein